jgi:transposase InsO family protein
MKISKGIKNSKRRYPNRRKRYGPEFKLKTIKLFTEESVPLSLIEKECGVKEATVRRWMRLYRRKGDAGLENRHGGSCKSRVPVPVKQKIIAVKRSHPQFGIKRISQLLKRVFFLKASPETVRKTLHRSSLMKPPARKRRRNITRPRFFERSTPNQLWQTDIFTFRLGGRYAFLIGYIDDYSRYITGLDLFRSQTADNVIEVYRRAIAEYNPPREMLTDNGRQYTSWRGTSRFESELKKDRIRHIRSQPHHPMTLGKIERFWKTIFQEFLERAQFLSFEDAQERIRQWVKYYNHKRPHQGIGGLCPADRYFEIQTELRKTIEQGIQENLLEMALRGKPRLPFYMVGRMEGQSVVLRAEKGKLRLSVDDEEEDRTQEVVYNLNDKGNDYGKDREDQDREETDVAEFRGDGEVPGGAVGMDGAAEARGDMPGAVDTVDAAVAVAEAGAGGHAAGPGAAGASGQGSGAQSEIAGDAGEASPVSTLEYRAGETGKSPVEGSGDQEIGNDSHKGREENLTGTEFSHESDPRYGVGASPGVGCVSGPQRGDNGRGGSEDTGCVPEDLLRVGGPGIAGNDRGNGGQVCREASPAVGPGETAPAGGGCRTPEEAVCR